MSVRVRFAPSPTGHVHIGNVRVAIFNWLFARHHGGKFLLRIEDTDLQRSTPEAVRTLLGALDWLGIDHDEDPVYQTRTRPRHDAVAARLIANGHAVKEGPDSPTVLLLNAALYDPSFVTEPAETITLDASRARVFATPRGLVLKNTSSKGEVFADTYLWDALADLEIALADDTVVPGTVVRGLVPRLCDGRPEFPVEEATGGRPQALRFKRRYVYFNDLVLGRREKPLESMHDLVIARSDGSPVFHLANVVDDVDMGITHILRGNDHVENTFRHLFLYRAMGETPPKYGHFPMIVNASGKPYSKRDGDAYVGDFQTRGVLPECLFNFLALCGWAPGDDREVMTRDEMVAAFDLGAVTETPAQFNLEKLAWMNNQYLVARSAESLLPLVRRHLAEGGIDTSHRDDAWMLRFTELVKVRVRTLAELPAYAGYFFTDDVTPDPKAVEKVLRKNDGAGLKVLAGLADALAALEGWSEPELERAILSFAQSQGLGMGAVAQPLRVAVTGGTASPGIWETLALVGRERSLKRIAAMLRREARTAVSMPRMDGIPEPEPRSS